MHKLEQLWSLRGIGLGSTNPIFCDLDNDDSIEIITENFSGDLIVVSGEQGLIKKRTSLIRERIRDMIVGDINKDNNLELIIATNSSKLVILNSELNSIQQIVPLPSIPIKIYSFDFDKDHIPEILVVDVTSAINLIKKNKIVSRITLNKPIYVLEFGKIKDDNSDRDLLIAIHNNLLSAYKVDPLSKIYLLFEKPLSFKISKATAYDIDNDGLIEFLIASNNKLFVLYNALGDALVSIKAFENDILNFAVTDLNHDGKKELILISKWIKGSSSLKIFNLNGSLISKYEIPIDASKIITGDVDGDGAQEIIISDVAGKEIFCLDIINNKWCKWVSRDNFLFVNLIDINCDLRDEIILRTMDGLIALKYI